MAKSHRKNSIGDRRKNQTQKQAKQSQILSTTTLRSLLFISPFPIYFASSKKSKDLVSFINYPSDYTFNQQCARAGRVAVLYVQISSCAFLSIPKRTALYTNLKLTRTFYSSYNALNCSVLKDSYHRD